MEPNDFKDDLENMDKSEPLTDIEVLIKRDPYQNNFTNPKNTNTYTDANVVDYMATGLNEGINEEGMNIGKKKGEKKKVRK